MDVDSIRNHAEQRDGQTVVYCVVCGDPDGETREHLDCANCGHSKEDNPGEVCQNPLCGHSEEVTRTVEVPPQGYAPVTMLKSVGWQKVGDALCCSVRCALEESGFTEEDEEYHAAMDAAAVDEVLTEEQVAAMNPPMASVSLGLDAFEEFSVQEEAEVE